ncbi:hypothetical protein BDM02DRAFT_3126083 [Thelephora ganbajun]|uniref:Uncharacterized protein n=1 Tax=Thelephora ganbajun TaxID=370292 RepID=A0ACB6ZTU3_THEGA|nr:hypothetical protein BDM02DRAFT_3126083 [Thelephora ganbajun]
MMGRTACEIPAKTPLSAAPYVPPSSATSPNLNITVTDATPIHVPETSKTAVITEEGKPVVGVIPTWVPGENETLVKVAAIGVDPTDWKNSSTERGAFSDLVWKIFGGTFSLEEAMTAGIPSRRWPPRKHKILATLGVDLIFDIPRLIVSTPFQYPGLRVVGKPEESGKKICIALDTIPELDTQAMAESKRGKVTVILRPSEEARNLRKDVGIIGT